MKKQLLFPLWAVWFILCGALGFIPQPEGLLRVILTVLSVMFFLPPALLLYGAMLSGDRDTVLLVRNLSALSLGLTLCVLILNFLCAFTAPWVGIALYYALVILSSPMICSGYWVLSLFLWACLMLASVKLLKQM